MFRFYILFLFIASKGVVLIYIILELLTVELNEIWLLSILKIHKKTKESYFKQLRLFMIVWRI